MTGMLKLIPVTIVALLLASCVTTPPVSPAPVSPAPSSPIASLATTTNYRPIPITAAMKAGMTSTRRFELVYALEYDTNRADKAVPETFGSLSSMIVLSQDARMLRFEVITDQGYFSVLDVPNAMAPTPQLSGTSLAVMLETRGPDGNPLTGPSNVDSEGLARTPEGRLISLERNHRLLRITDAAAFNGQASIAGPALTGFEGLEPNGGMEALVALPDGRYLASAEFGRSDQGPEAKLKPPYWIFSLDQQGPIAPAGSFTNTGGFGVTEARVMDNDLWVLKREYDFTTKINKARLERCPLAGVLAGAPLCTLELALEPPFAMDNYEGLEIFKQPNTGDLYFYIVSDDNFSAQQRTIMLAFKVPG
jgi:hypothetical protein